MVSTYTLRHTVNIKPLRKNTGQTHEAELVRCHTCGLSVWFKSQICPPLPPFLALTKGLTQIGLQIGNIFKANGQSHRSGPNTDKGLFLGRQP